MSVSFRVSTSPDLDIPSPRQWAAEPAGCFAIDGEKFMEHGMRPGQCRTTSDGTMYRIAQFGFRDAGVLYAVLTQEGRGLDLSARRRVTAGD